MDRDASEEGDEDVRAVVSAAAQRGGMMPGAFIGRERELAHGLAALEDAFRGRGAVLLLAGEAGIGKTALAEAVASRAAERGARVAWSRSWEGGDAAPYWMWAQIVRSLIEGVDDETLRSFLSPGTEQVALLAPELADRFTGAAKSQQVLDSAAGRFYLFESTARFLKQVSSTTPLILVFDDVLVGDQPSLLLLRFLARDVRTSHMLILATYRDAEPSRSSDAVEVLADLVREGSGVELRGLSRKEVRRLITEVAGVEPAQGKVAAIHEATGGNPLFVREVTRLLASVEPLDQSGRQYVPVPDTVRAVIRSRLAPLSADAVQVLSAAAVVGSHFDLALVHAACECPGDRIFASLAEAMSLGIVAEEAATPRRYRFSHPLMREAIYEGLPVAARADMHRRVGLAIERLHGSDAAGRLDELALHFSKAAAMGESARACEYATRAGDRAMDSFAYEQAVVQYERALDVLTLTGEPDPPRRCNLLLSLGHARARAGDYRQSKESFLLASDLARDLGAAEQLGRAALGYGEPQVEGGLVDRQLVALLEEAIRLLRPEDSALRVKLLSRLSLELTFADVTSRLEERRQALSLEALEMARRLDDLGALVGALRCRWLARWGPNGLEERARLCDEWLALGLETGDREIELHARARRAACALEAGDIVVADTDIAAHTRLAEELHMPYHEWAAATMHAGRALLAGSFDRVETLAQEARDRLPGRPNAVHAYINQLTPLRWEQGRLGELHGTWQELVERYPQLAFERGWLCLAEAERSRVEEARRTLQELVGAIPEIPRGGLWLSGVALASVGASQLGETDAAASLYPLLLPYAEHVIVIPMPHPAICFGSTSFYLGILAAEIGSWDEAEDHFEAAIAAHQRLGARPFLAHSYYEHARVLVRRGRAGAPDRARGMLDRASALASSVGMPRLGENIDSLRERISGAEVEGEPLAAEPTGPGAASGAGVPAEPGVAAASRHLFRREGEYWTIAYEGPVVRLKDSKGLRCLARLLASPGREFAAVELEASESETSEPARVPVGRASGWDEFDEVRPNLGDAGELLDAQAKADYKSRIGELRADLDEAERFNDPGRATRAQEELEFLTSELARAVGLRGRDRRAGSHAERARLNVTRAIRAAMRKLARVQPSLAEHLSATIRTGQYCSYTPDPRVPITWEF